MSLAFLVKVKIRLAFIFSLEKMSVWIRIAEHMSPQLLRENFMRDMFVGNVACMPEGIP